MFIVLIIVGVLAASYIVGWGLEVLWKRLRKTQELTTPKSSCFAWSKAVACYQNTTDLIECRSTLNYCFI